MVRAPGDWSRMAARLADLMQRPHEQVHASWHEPLAGLAGVSAAVGPGVGARLGLALFEQWCGPLPALSDLARTPAHWCLLERDERRARLAALALSRQPGALRSCLRRSPRQALEAALGPAYPALLDLAQGAPAVPPERAEQAPEAWALEGHRLLARAGLWPTPSLRRWARLGLPRRVARRPAQAAVGAGVAPSDVDAWFAA